MWRETKLFTGFQSERTYFRFLFGLALVGILSCTKMSNSSSSSDSDSVLTTETTIVDRSDFSSAEESISESEDVSESTDVMFGSEFIDTSNTVVLEPEEGCVHPEVKKDCAAGWCRIPNGCFIFGSVDTESPNCRAKYAEDQVQVTLTHDFEMRQTEVTQDDWVSAGFELPNPVVKAPCPECPIPWITIYEAMAYCNKLSEKAGYESCYNLTNCTGSVGTGCSDDRTWFCSAEEEEDVFICSGNLHIYVDPYSCPGYRLPTTAEWEYAARAGTRTTTYAGDLDDEMHFECFSHEVLDPIAWYCDNTNSDEPNYIPVGQKLPNGFGLYDMLGNLGEFCGSTYENRSLNKLVNQEGPLTNPAQPLAEYDKHMEVVLRSPYYISPPCLMRSADVYPGTRAGQRRALHGFRPVRTLDIALDTPSK